MSTADDNFKTFLVSILVGALGAGVLAKIQNKSSDEIMDMIKQGAFGGAGAGIMKVFYDNQVRISKSPEDPDISKS
jgi:hypothetical protein